ncbi:MAG TPA: crosslink repair DNA glycosylase YcaQ family protein, partial [Thermoplasmata archaeon]|nr:crosslink repair DNA glycosylase YcaQ family protein [Thermoplasmata archaeon]
MARTDTGEISWPQVHAFRLRRHHLDRPATRGQLVRVASDMCGAQAQILSAGRLSFRARTRNLRPSDVDRALSKDRSLVAAWCMRGTRHFIPSKEFAVYSRGCHTHIGPRWTSWFVRHRWPMDTVERIVASIGRAMDQPRTRDEILRLVTEDLGLETARKRMSRGWGNVSHTDGLVIGKRVVSMRGMIGYACNLGLACCGPEDGSEATFVRPDAWIPGFRDLAIPDAERELVRRYLRAYAPATPEDFSLWAAFPLR